MRLDPITDQSRQDAARAWVVKLARYREPSTWRSLFELAVTLVPFVLLWALAWAALDVSAWLSVAIAVVNGGFLVRIFIIQHDLGHASYFGNRSASDWLGRALGVITLTPYDVWRRTHAIHHAHHGNLSHRGIGDVLISWENEAYLAVNELGPDDLEIVVPSVSILAEPSVAVVNGNADAKGNGPVAKAYLDYLYSAEGQKLAAKHYYRPRHPELADPADLARLQPLETFTIRDLFGSWAAAQATHFGDGGVFDQIYEL
jgi:hypothetical protein